MPAHLAVRLDYGTVIAQDRHVARRAAELVTRPPFTVLARVSARKLDRWGKHTGATAETVESYLADPSNDAVALDNGRSGELFASAEIQSGPGVRLGGPAATRFLTYLVLPLDLSQLEGVLAGVCNLAAALRIAAGFMTLEPTHGLAQKAALGQFIPKERTGLSEQRSRERRVRDYKSQLIDTHLAGIEWGTFLGPGHLERIEVAELRGSGAFERVIEVTPSLLFLQLTANPEDDLSPDIEPKLARARATLKSLLLETHDLPKLPQM